MEDWEYELKLRQLNRAVNIERSVEGSDLNLKIKEQEAKNNEDLNKAVDLVNDTFNKGLITELQAELFLEKAINHKYFKREGTAGNYKYFYTEDEYRQSQGKDSKDIGKEPEDDESKKKVKFFEEFFNSDKDTDSIDNILADEDGTKHLESDVYYKDNHGVYKISGGGDVPHKLYFWKPKQ
jgi:hypothetical protein